MPQGQLHIRAITVQDGKFPVVFKCAGTVDAHDDGSREINVKLQGNVTTLKSFVEYFHPGATTPPVKLQSAEDGEEIELGRVEVLESELPRGSTGVIASDTNRGTPAYWAARARVRPVANA